MIENAVLRSGLLERIEASGKNLILIRGMAGYGKSVLLSQLADRIQGAAMCVLGQSDNSLRFFVRHFSSVIHNCLPYCAAGSAEDSYENLSRLCSLAAENSLTILFDNCETVREPEVSRAIHSILTMADSGFQVVMASRNIPDFAVRFIFEENIAVFGRDDLSMSEAETAAGIKMRLGGDDPGLARELCEISGGWAAGIMFCLNHCGGSAAEASDLQRISKHGLMKQYVTYNVLSELPAEMAEFAKRASLFKRFGADFCDCVFGFASAQEYLDYLCENEIFLRKCPDEANAYQWIEMFQNMMSELLPAAEKLLIAGKAVDYYVLRKKYDEAMDTAVRFGQPALLCKVLSLCGPSLLQEKRFALLGVCAEILEKSGMTLDAPIYGILAQYHYISADYSKMEYCFNMADSMFGKENTYSILRSFYRGLLKFKEDPGRYRRHVNNALFYMDEFNLKIPILLPREQKVLEEIRSLNAADEETQSQRPLRVRQFGIFQAVSAEDGHEISWRTKKGSELFAYLITLNGGAVERSRIFDVIWKEELPNNPVAMLHNMIYNIRKELSAYKLENLLQYKSKKYSVDMSLIDCDMEAVNRICAAVSRKDMDVLLENEGILSDYWGAFLENIDSVWVTELRDYYDKMFVNACVILADFYFDNKIYEKAAVLLQNALKVDTFSERIMGKLLNCYSQMDKFDKLRVKYKEFCEMLQHELDIEPSNDLKLSYQRSIQRRA